VYTNKALLNATIISPRAVGVKRDGTVRPPALIAANG
jgi:hypothetical protein